MALKYIGLIFFALASVKTWAYPEMIRHGYANCIACHVSPNGGGALTEYGRMISKELLSTWSAKDEESFLYLAKLKKKIPEKIHVGGDIRTAYTFRSTPTRIEGSTILMQSDLEAYYSLHPKVTVGGSLGLERVPPGGFLSSKVSPHYKSISRKHYLLVPFYPNYFFRLGKFIPELGINMANHTAVTKRNLGFGPGSENYNLELSYIGQNWGHFFTVGYPDKKNNRKKEENSLSYSISRVIDKKFKLGSGLFYAKGDQHKRMIWDIYGILGLRKDLFLLSELDFQKYIYTQQRRPPPDTLGLVTYQKLSYEFTKGLHLYYSYEMSYLDFKNARSRSDYHGIGSQWFPRPHFEIDLLWQKQRSSAFSKRYTDYSWLMFHYYL